MAREGQVNGDKHIHVTCAIIERDGLVLAAQRSAAMSLPLKWEFPGGKIDPGESPEACLRRELVEEMGIHVHVGRSLPASTHQYLGPVDRMSYESERPIKMVWRLRYTMPVEMFEDNRRGG